MTFHNCLQPTPRFLRKRSNSPSAQGGGGKKASWIGSQIRELLVSILLDVVIPLRDQHELRVVAYNVWVRGALATIVLARG